MKKQKKALKIVSVTLGITMGVGTLGVFAGCGESAPEALTVMTDALNGLFSPFFSTAGTDMNVVGQTQISMLNTDENGKLAYGDDEAVVVKDYLTTYDGNANKTTYTMVLKNGITFSDGKPLTMNDVMFNMYVYLDPAYTGSSTMYSTDIVGLEAYRTQTNVEGTEDTLVEGANARADARRQQLISLFQEVGRKPGNSSGYEASVEEMMSAISTAYISDGYKEAIGTNVSDTDARTQLQKDYEEVMKLYKEELATDYASAQEAFVEDPYKSAKNVDFSDEVLCFMIYEGYAKFEYEMVAGKGEDKNKIIGVNKEYNASAIDTKEKAIEHVYNDKIQTALHEILLYWATGTTVFNNYVAKAKDVILHENLTDGELAYKNISGIVSLGHTSDKTAVTINGTTYQVAHEHNADGTPAKENEYDVLEVTINGVDPKAQWNFAFSVAPHHYYSDATKYPVDIANNQFGVEWSSFDFMTGVLQGENANGISKNKIPMGAGPYVATDNEESDNPTAESFYYNNYVFYKANENFIMGAPKIRLFRYRYVSSSNAISSLEQQEVHFVEPQYTPYNFTRIRDLSAEGIESQSTWQLGYGYVGVNAGKIPDVELRRAIMASMNTGLISQYYVAGSAVQIAWPMSAVSWAYPRTAGESYNGADPVANMETNNDHAFTQWAGEDAARAYIQSQMDAVGASKGDSRLKVKFTISGSNLTEHPLYTTFIQSMQLLNSMGWEVSVEPDTNALVKLSTGSLTVWAAAWGSTIDPDMYQVYHKDSTATSVLSWGYREILADSSTYSYENGIINKLSKVIDGARKITDETERAKLYKEAMGYVLDLAVELPVYQRKVMYAYNANIIDTATFPENINSYTSPLSKIWEIDFVK